MVSRLVFFVGVALALGSVACAPMAASVINSGLKDQKNGGDIPPEEPDLSCLRDLPQFEVSPRIDSFELTSGMSIGGGFKPGAVIPIEVGGKIGYSKGALRMSMDLSAPLYGPHSIATGIEKGTTFDFEFSIYAAAAIAKGEFSAWSKTGLYRASQAAIENTFEELKKNQRIQPVWSSVISESLGNGVYLLPVGADAGLMKGDEFHVYKTDYIWSGDKTPCKNPLLTYNRPETPFATIKVLHVDHFVATAAVQGNIELEPYDRIEIGKLVSFDDKTERTELRFSVRLKGFTQAEELVFTNGKETHKVDMTKNANILLNDFVQHKDGGYYVH